MSVSHLIPDFSPKEPPRFAEALSPDELAWSQAWLRLDRAYPPSRLIAVPFTQFALGLYRNKPETPRLFVIAGDTGVGKTYTLKEHNRWLRHAAFSAWESRYWPHAIQFAYHSWSDLLDQMRAGEYGSFNQCCDDEDVLHLDDIGAEHDPTKFAASKLKVLLDRRAGRFTILTTNIPMAGWPAAFDSRIHDRLFRKAYHVFLFGQPSYAVWRGKQRRAK